MNKIDGESILERQDNRQRAREIVGELKTPEEVFKIVDQDKVFYQQSGGGVTFSGGEPFLHPEFIQKVSAMCKAEGYKIGRASCRERV